MNCPHCEASSYSAEGLEQIATCKDCRGDWMTNPSGKALFRDNLIYLPFASHLADEDAEAESIERAA